MSEPRRIEVMSAVGVNTEKNKTKMTPTIRLLVPLTESTDDTYPEFSYVELLCKNSEALQGSSVDPRDPFGAQDQAEHDKLIAIARSFDSKYGSQPGKKHHTSMIEDFIDLGEGYEEDSFVDNSEAYDELVPSTMRTKYGGFYINSGELDFVPVDDHSTDGHILKKKMKKRRVIESDNEEVGRSDKKRKVLKMKENGSDEPLKKKRKKLNVEDGKRFKGPPGYSLSKGPPGRALKSDKCKTVADFLHEASHTSNVKPSDASPNLPVSPTHKTSTPGMDKLVVSSPIVASRPLPISTDQRDLVPDKDLPVEPKVESTAAKNEPTVSAIESSIDAVIIQSREEAVSENLKETASEMNLQSLPNSIPMELLKNVERMKELSLAGKVTSDESSSGQRFTNEAQQLLSEIHESISALPQNDRLAVFSYLGCYFPSGKEGLIKRMKKLDLTLHGDQLKVPVAKLKEAIQAVMPSLIEKHRVEVIAKERQRMDQLQEQKERKEPKDGVAQSDSDEDEENRDTAEKQRRIVAPRKKFEWNDDIRKLLCKVVDIKMEHFEMSKIRSQTPEDYLKSFLEAEVKPLWPPGWIQTRMLFKESRSSHNRWTCNTQRMKKGAPVFPKTSTPVVTAPHDISELGLGHQSANLSSFSSPVAVPGIKVKLLLEEALTGNLNKLQESPVQVASSTPGMTVTNGAKEDPSGEVLFTSINCKPANKYEREMNRNNGCDMAVENDKVKKGLLSRSPVFVHEAETVAKRPAAPKPMNIDGTVEMTDSKVINISSSTGSDTSVVSKAEMELHTASLVDVHDSEKLSKNLALKSMTPAGLGNSLHAQGFLDESLSFPSKRTSPAGGGGDVSVATDSIRSSLPEQFCKAEDKHDPVSYLSSSAPLVEQFLRLNSGKSSDAASLSLGALIAQDSTTKFTELRSLQRQSSTEVGSQLQPMSVSMPLVPDNSGMDLQTVMAPPVSHRVPDVSPHHVQQESNSLSPRGQSSSALILSKALNQGLYKMVPVPQQKLTVSSPSNNFSKWNSKATSTTARTLPLAVDERPKYSVEAGKTSGNRLTSGNVVSTLASPGHEAVYMPKDLPSRTMASRNVSSSEKGTAARVPSSRPNVVPEEIAKMALLFSQARQNMPGDDLLKNDDFLRLLTTDSWQSILESCHSSQGLNKITAAEARPFEAGGTSELAKHFNNHDHSRQLHGKTTTVTTTTQSLWRPSDKTQTISPILNANSCPPGYRVGQHPSTGLSDRVADYSQHQSIKTSNPSSTHDHIQMADAVRFSGSQLQSLSSMATSQPQKTIAFYTSSGELRNAPSSQAQNSTMHNVHFKTDSQSSQHRCQ